MNAATHVAVAKHVARLKPHIENLFRAQWEDPELPGMEYRSAARLRQFLSDHGFDVGDAPGHIPTAFVAGKRKGDGPVVAILAEYDALPGLAAEAKDSYTPLPLAAGHACGHNHIGPANTAAAIIAAAALAEGEGGGEVRVIGCPAEEILWGKIALLDAGAFGDVDVVLTSHGDYQTGALSRPCQSVVMGEFVFLGRAGHAGFKTATNALLAAESFVAEVEQAGRRDFAAVQFRHVLRRAGVTPGITPDEVRVWYQSRAPHIGQARAAYAMMIATAERIAAEQGLRWREQFISETRGYLPNDVLGRVLADCMKNVGPPQWSADDVAFMSALTATCAPGEPMRLDRTTRYFDTGEDYYGQDDGEVSWRVPLGRVNWAYPEQVPIHHWAWTALSGHPASFPGPLMAVQALAAGALAILRNPSHVELAKAELQRRTADTPPDRPRLGAQRTLRDAPETFWNATWTEVSP